MRPASTTAAVRDACAATAGLTWALVDGELRHVSAYAALPPRERPAAHCPACGGEVILKLGAVRVHHVAHRSGEECAASRPESVLHLNVKCHVAAGLRAAIGRDVPLRVREPCVAGRLAEPAGAPPGADAHPPSELHGTPCVETREQPWLAAWDQVELEHTLAAADAAVRRPDIVLHRAGRAIGAVEIRHHHAVDAAKARSLAALGVPWIEVRADPALVDAATGWAVEQPLPVVQRGPDGPWRCRWHAARRAEWERRRAEAAAAERETVPHVLHLEAVRLVDLYYPSGNCRRLCYRIDAVERDGGLVAYALRRDGMPVTEVRLADAAGQPVAPRLRAAFRAEMRAVAARHAATVDSPMRWASGALGRTIERLWGEDRAALARTHPRRYRWVRAQQRWFQPRDLAGVSWDRDADAPLEPHPAAERTPPPRRARRVPEAAIPDPRNPRTPGAPGVRGVPSHASAVREGPAAPGGAFPHDGSPASHRLEPAEVGPCVVAREELPGATVYVLAEAPGGAPTRHVLVVPAARLRATEVQAIDDRLLAAGRQRLWLSHADDWTRELAAVPWLPIYRLPSGAIMVSLWGRSLRLADVSAAIARGDRRFRPAALARSTPAARLPR